MGSSIVIEVKSKTSSTDTSSAISADLKASWSGYGDSVSGGAGFSKKLSENKKLTSSEILVRMSGHDKGKGVSSLDIEKANDEILNFGDIAQKGTGLATILKRFDRHPDYIATINSDHCTKPDKDVTGINARAEKIIYEEIVALNILLDWCRDDKYIPRGEKRPITDAAWRKLEELEEVATKGVKPADARKYQYTAEDLIIKFKAVLDKHGGSMVHYKSQSNPSHLNVVVSNGIWGAWNDIPREYEHFACGMKQKTEPNQGGDNDDTTLN